MGLSSWLLVAALYCFVVAGGMAGAAWRYSAHHEVVRRLQRYGCLSVIVGFAVIGAALVSG